MIEPIKIKVNSLNIKKLHDLNLHIFLHITTFEKVLLGIRYIIVISKTFFIIMLVNVSKVTRDVTSGVYYSGT